MDQPLSRRTLLATAAFAGAAAFVPGSVLPLARRASAAGAAPPSLKVLVLGGTGQTGPFLVQELLSRGHVPTLFNRGSRAQEMFPEVECLIGDRTIDRGDGLRSLEEAIAAGRSWDICIDIWPHIPKIVEHTASLLRGHVGRYMFVSSMSVYTDNAEPDMDESAPVSAAPDADDQTFTMALFGPFKAECEARVRRIFADDHLIFRPGLIVGPRDASFRGGYWPVRVRRGGEVLAPGDGSDRIQMIDGRDLTRFQVRCMEAETRGTFNVVGNGGGEDPRAPLTMRAYLEACREATKSDASFVWADAAFLARQGVRAWSHMPAWVPMQPGNAGFAARNIDAALAAGLTFRPLTETVRDTLHWFDELSDSARETTMARAGLSPERETEVLAAWHAP